MSSDAAIRVVGLGKKYRLGLTHSGSIRELVNRLSRKLLLRRTGPSPRGGEDRGGPSAWHTPHQTSGNGSQRATLDSRPSRDFWAVKDVSFEVKRGEVLGIIGRNGAGKSTLLKILSQVTKPTEGQAEIRGRVGCLLEVGTGFHPELTGRENVYLNGAILGMSRAEVKKKFDDILGFSGVEQFVDTPVKRYSSGMKVRLGFAVAAYLEPDVLIIDEVLAVGDATFQKRCLGKMDDFATSGRTVLFVSHNMAAVRGLCTRSVLLENGRAVFIGNSHQAVERYVSGSLVDDSKTTRALGCFDVRSRANEYSPGELIIRRIELLNAARVPAETFLMGDCLCLRIELAGLNAHPHCEVGIIVKSLSGDWLAIFNTGMKPPKAPLARRQHELLTLQIPRLPLIPGSYRIDVSAAQQGVGRIDYVENAAEFQVVDSDIYGTGYAPRSNQGVFFLDGVWDIDNSGV